MNRWPCPVCGRLTMRRECDRCQRRAFVVAHLPQSEETEEMEGARNGD